MNLISKFKETVFSVLPVMLIVILLSLTAAPLGISLLLRFLLGGFMLIFGLTFFLLGVDIGIQPIGEQSGAALTSKRNLPLLLVVSLVIGFLVTVAEPDIQVFGDQIHSVFSSVNKTQLVFMIASGVGLFMAFGLFRTIISMNLKLTLLVCYTAIFLLAFAAPSAMRGVAFDSGGATTGPMTVPFILALGVGVSRVRAGKNSDSGESFGLTGITSIGPVAAVLIYSLFLNKNGFENLVSSSSHSELNQAGLGIFGELLPHAFYEAAVSLLPIVLMLIFFQVFLLKLPPHKLIRISIGLIYSFLGLAVFLLGVNGGFMAAGSRLGFLLGSKACSLGGFWYFLLIFTGFVLGAVVVCAEPAVWVLTEQVENLSGGAIKRKLMLVFLSAGAASAIALAMWRALSGFNLMYLLIPGYALSLLLMIFSPSLFTGIAFDSGGVASGPITSTFVLSFTIGASAASDGNADSFGVIALVAMTPLIAIQILGIIYNMKVRNRNNSIQNGGA